MVDKAVEELPASKDEYLQWLSMEKQMEIERNRALAERDGWKEIACTLMAAATNSTVEEHKIFELPPIEIASAWTKDDEPLSTPFRAQLKEWWKNAAFKYSGKEVLTKEWKHLAAFERLHWAVGEMLGNNPYSAAMLDLVRQAHQEIKWLKDADLP